MEQIATYLGIIILGALCYEALRVLFYARRAIIAGKQAKRVCNVCQNAHKRVLIIGDSFTYGTGAEKPENSLAGRLAQEFPDIEIINESENALSLKDLTKKLLRMDKEKFDLIIINTGGVDTLSFTSHNTITQHFNTIQECTKKMSDAPVVLMTVTNLGSVPLIRFPFSLLYDRQSEHITKHFAHIATETGMIHVPFYTSRAEDPLLISGERLFASDQIHPNDIGYGIWYQKLRSAIHPYIIKPQ